MQNYLPDFIEGLLNILIAAVFVAYFFIPKYPKLYKKKALILGALCLFALGGNGIYKGFNAYLNQKIPTQAEVENSISQKGIVTLKDFIFSSTDGYRVLIPAGFTYSEPGGVISIIAIRDLNQETSAVLIVMKITESKNLDQLIDDILKLEPNGKTYFFDKEQKGKDLRKGIVEVQKDGVFVKGAIALIKKGSSIYQVMLSTKVGNFEQIERLFERILSSFEVV